MNDYEEAVLIKRINRFVAHVRFRRKDMKVYVPNTGRMAELVIPGSRVVLVPSPGLYRYKIRFIYYDGYPVMIDSISSNSLVKNMLLEKTIPGLEDFTLKKTEPRYENHRFDYALSDGNGNDRYLELKSCTLAWNGISAFPDAVSSRASKHIEKLAETGKGMVLFLIMHRGVRVFIPNYHTDFAFYRALRSNSDNIKIMACSADFDNEFNVRELKSVPVKLPRVEPSGCYLIIFENKKKSEISVGGLGPVTFKPGCYVYAGSGRNNVIKRIEHHRRKGGAKHWHLDYIKPHMRILSDIPFITDKISECGLARFLETLQGVPVPGFGSSDCTCPSHFYFFRENPSGRRDFWDFVLKTRFSGIY